MSKNNMDLKILQEIGLEKDEVGVYISLLKFGSSTATKVASETSIYRTNVYRILDSLALKGIVSHVFKNNVKYFSAESPRKLVEDQKNKLESLKNLVPQLESISDSLIEDFKVDVFKGKEGLISVLKYVIREKKDYIVFGEEGRLQKILPNFIEQLLRDVKHFNIKERMLSKESLRGEIMETKNSKIKYLEERYFSPVMTVVFGNYTAIFIWDEPYQAILIKSKATAKGYKNYFEALWKIAKK